jgi:hypothetical protein
MCFCTNTQSSTTGEHYNVRYRKPVKVYEIDGAQFSTLEEFFFLFGHNVASGWNLNFANLDGFNDVLRGEFGTPKDGFRIVWKNHILSKDRLGYAETVRQLERRLTTCHPANVGDVQESLEQARANQGQTVFDWIVEIIREHGASGRESEDGVDLILA